MAAPAVGGLGSLTWHHGVKVASAVSVEDCCLAVGNVEGHQCILLESRMNNVKVIFLSLVGNTNKLV